MLFRSDKHIGTILVRYAKPIIKAVIENGTKDQIRKLSKYIMGVNRKPEDVSHLVVDDAVDLDYLGGGSKAIPNPKEFYSVLMDNIAINFGIPKSLLIGTEQGSISGSDLNLVSYFRTVEVEQEQIVGKNIRQILSEYWRLKYRAPFPEEINLEFESVYADEMAHFKSTLMNSQALISLYNAGIITKNEARNGLGFDRVEEGGDEFVEKPQKQPQKEKPTTPEGEVRGRSANIPVVDTGEEE